jgi:hypothetical protein
MGESVMKNIKRSTIAMVVCLIAVVAQASIAGIIGGLVTVAWFLLIEAIEDIKISVVMVGMDPTEGSIDERD